MNSAGDHKCHDTHKHTSHGVGHIVVAAVNGGGSNAQRGDAEENAEAWHIGADCQRRRGDRRRVGARKQTGLHAEVVQNPEVHVA